MFRMTSLGRCGWLALFINEGCCQEVAADVCDTLSQTEC